MKLRHFFVLSIALIAATLAGWLIDWSQPDQDQNALEIPDNIDYYLTHSKWYSFNASGDLQYQLKSPYIEHYVREDISVIQQPDMIYQQGNTEWTLSAGNGRLMHQSDQLEFSRAVKLTRLQPEHPMQIRTETLLFIPSDEVVRVNSRINVDTVQYSMQAQSAVMDFKQGQHIFKKVKAVYNSYEKTSG